MARPVVAVGAGRFDAETDAVVARLHRAAKTHPVYMATEITGKQWRAIKANLPAGWWAVRQNEFVIAWDHRVLVPRGIGAKWAWLSRGLFNRGRIRIRAKVGQIRLAERAVRKDEGCYYSVVHLPAHIQRGDHYTTDPAMQDEVKAHKQALKTLGRRAARRQERHPERKQCVTGDVNVDLFSAVWRARLRAEIGLTAAIRSGTLPARGDMGHRLITGAWTYGFGGAIERPTPTTFVTVPLTPADEKGLDHRMVEVWV